VSGKKRPTCLWTALDLPPPWTRLRRILARSMTEKQGQNHREYMRKGLDTTGGLSLECCG